MHGTASGVGADGRWGEILLGLQTIGRCLDFILTVEAIGLKWGKI